MNKGKGETFSLDSMTRNPKTALVRVLVVDDSSFMRKALTHILEADTSIKVIDTGTNGEDAVRKTKQLHPDVVLLDIEMPVMDGLTALSHIMTECPTPVVMLSAMNRKSASVTMDSLERGAVDFISKPSGVISYDIGELQTHVIDKVKAAATSIASRRLRCPPSESCLHPPAHVAETDIVVIGASTGGPMAVVDVVSGLPHHMSAAVLIVQHLSDVFVPAFTNKLNRVSPLGARVAEQGQLIHSGTLLVAPGSADTAILTEDGVKRIDLKTTHNRITASPSIDCTMESVASAYGSRAIGILLTGLGSDGARGMKAIKDCGGRTIAQDAHTSTVFSMPQAAIALGCVDRVVPLPLISTVLLEML